MIITEWDNGNGWTIKATGEDLYLLQVAIQEARDKGKANVVFDYNEIDIKKI